MSRQSNHDRYLETSNVNHNGDDEDDDDEDDDDYSPNNEDHASESDSTTDHQEEEETVGQNDEAKSETKKKTDDVTIDTNKLDELWNDFCSDKPVAAKASQPDANQSTKATITKQYDFAGEIVLINETVDANQTKSIDDNDQQAETASSSSSSANVGVKRSSGSGGLSGLLTQLKKPKISTLKKSLHDWAEFKESNKFEEELDQHRRSKGSFLERQAFLSRTDFREFEREKSVRDRQRKLRDLKQQNN
ncbi:craniofacial development protein 1 isoform X2 [Dermatophagoides farinae]|uniref:craniofacial development protein 1 isoform X2 n=1 Tax=Dermatophagoides farinae TaxID=6954 RepID=UPI003F5EC5EC